MIKPQEARRAVAAAAVSPRTTRMSVKAKATCPRDMCSWKGSNRSAIGIDGANVIQPGATKNTISPAPVQRKRREARL
ncbi:hypothetical protein [Methylobacterium sp. J-068]|uniref:hypothetical protein n=1 Tax=Methylobacterium sp. J-068 TaxID=2836649 RepID=UPI001FBB65E4|nr:hypothetical protein [Methylobacterium sp. J-068]MCJ2033545.1 hypothetical protein [Methylobacterium sp. J-068]